MYMTISPRLWAILSLAAPKTSFKLAALCSNRRGRRHAESFKMAALDSFDPFVYLLFGFIAGTAQATDEPQSWEQDWTGYAKRYGLAFADNTMCSLITTGLMQAR